MACPFLFLTLSFIAGILLSFLLEIPLAFSTVLLLVALGGGWILWSLRKPNWAWINILLAAFFLGSGLYLLHDRAYEKNRLHQFHLDGYADFFGEISRSPSRGIDNDFLYIKVKKISYQNREENLEGNLRLSVVHSPEFPHPFRFLTHDLVKVSAQLSSSSGFRNFDQGSLRNYLKNQKIHKLAFTKSPLLVEKHGGSSRVSLLRLISFLRREFQDKIEKHFTRSSSGRFPSEGGILEALLLGERERMPEADILSLQKTGIFHLFAISGAHIGIISFLLFSILKMAKVPTRISYAVLIIVLCFYAFLVEGRASVARATTMAIIFLVGKLLWKDVHLLNTLAFSAFFLLLVNPFSLFDVGFQLTFAATLSLVLLFPKIIKHLPKLPLKISEIFGLSLSAQLGVLPIMAATFNRITFTSLLLNYLAFPLVGAIMALGYIFLPFSFLSPFFADYMATILQFLISLFMAASRVFEKIPLLSFRIPTPPLWVCLGYVLFLLSLLLAAKRKKLRLGLFAGFAILLTLLISHPFSSSSKFLKVTFIDVGQGDSILVEFPGDKKMLIDGGGFPKVTFDVGERVVSPFLWRKGIKRIDYLVLTHGHPDHLLGLKAIVQNFHIGEFWEGYSPTRDELYKELMKILPPTVTKKRVFRGFSHGEGQVLVEVLHPQEGPSPENVDNDHSLVLRISYGKTSFLFPGDIGTLAEKAIVDLGENIHSQVLKSAHHGSNSSSSEYFLEKIDPAVVVISVGEKNAYGLPHKEILDRYLSRGIKVLRTDLNGAVEISSDGTKFSIRLSEPRINFPLFY